MLEQWPSILPGLNSNTFAGNKSSILDHLVATKLKRCCRELSVFLRFSDTAAQFLGKCAHETCVEHGIIVASDIVHLDPILREIPPSFSRIEGVERATSSVRKRVVRPG